MNKLPRLAALFLACAVTATAAPTPPPDKLLPADTLAVLTLPDYASVRKASQQNPARQLWDDPAMKPFKDKFMAKFQSDLVKPLEKEFGLKFADYSGLAQGQVTLALTPGEWDGENDAGPGFLLLLDARDKSDQLKTNLSAIKQKWIDGGKKLKTDKIRDVEFTTLIFNSDDLSKTFDKIFPDPNAGNETLDAPKPKKAPKKIELLIGQSDSLLIVANSAKDVEKILLRQTGGSLAPLGEQAAFAREFNSTFRDAGAYGWVNLKVIIDALVKKAGKPGNDKPGRNQGMPGADKIMAALGLTALQSASFSLREQPDGTLISAFLGAPAADRKGLLKAISFEAKDAQPPAWVPADAVKFSRLRLDLPKGLDALEKAVTEAVPQMAGVLKLLLDNAGKDKDPDFDLRKNLIANLGDDVISYQKSPRKLTLEGMQSPPSLTLLSSPKAEQLAAAMKAIGGLLPGQNAKVKEREFLGRKVYSMNFTTPQGRGGKGTERTLSYAASGSYVAMSTDVALLEEYLRNTGNAPKSLRDTPGLADAAQHVGGMGTGLFAYENQAETMKTLVETLKKESGTLANLFSANPLAGRLGMADDPKQFKDWVDFSLLPPFEKIARYFNLNVVSGTVTGDGISLKTFTPTPPLMKK